MINTILTTHQALKGPSNSYSIEMLEHFYQLIKVLDEIIDEILASTIFELKIHVFRRQIKLC
jgi:hypothetical protein